MNRMASSILWAAALFLLLAVTSTSAEERRQFCPSECHCSTRDSVMTVHCTSFDFLRKLSPKEVNSITSLDISNSSIHTLDKKLKKLLNLEKLNLSHNRLSEIKHFPYLPRCTHINLRSNLIKTFSSKQLPGHLEFLDVSHNHIRELPPDLAHMQSLKRIYVAGNPLTCTRESMDTRDMLLERKVDIIGHVLCHGPAKFHGQSWLHAVDFDEYFKLHNPEDMQAEQPEGSGDTTTNIDLSDEGSGDLDVFPPMVIKPTIVPETEESDKSAGDNDFYIEGSGEEDISLTTHIPILEESEEDNDEGSGIVHNFLHDTDDEIVSSNPVVEEQAIDVRYKGVGQVPPAEPEVVKERDNLIEQDNEDDSGSSHINEELGNLEANQSDSKSLGTNIFLAIFMICLVALLMYAIKKNKERKRQSEREKGADIEKQNAGMELLSKERKPSEKQNGNPEATPLMNGQNGASADQEKEMEANAPSNLPQTPVQLRKKDMLNDSSSIDGTPHLSVPSYPPSPDVMSVKVRASEIPDSIPRTPILVDRRKTSDGQHVVVTPNLNQRASTGD